MGSLLSLSNGKILSFLLLVSLVYYSTHLLTLPLWREIRPTVVNSCLDLSCGVNFYSGFLLLCLFVVEGRGEMLGNYWGGGLRYCFSVRELGGGGGSRSSLV